MYKGNKYFYLALIAIILSIFLSVHNPIVKDLFGSIMAIVLFTGVAGSVLMIISILLVDKALKSDVSDGVRKWAKILPLIIFIVILYHLFSGLFLFGLL